MTVVPFSVVARDFVQFEATLMLKFLSLLLLSMVLVGEAEDFVARRLFR